MMLCYRYNHKGSLFALRIITMSQEDVSFMQEALSSAREALRQGEVPIGCVAVHEGAVIARVHNQRETWQDPTAHAEIIALRESSGKLGRWRLTGVTFYVTLEPCAMCAGALVLARIDRLVYGSLDPKAGACGSVMDIVRDPRLNHRIDMRSGVLEEECQMLLKAFFAQRR
jgi:tRNA(adenine34) deaminase